MISNFMGIAVVLIIAWFIGSFCPTFAMVLTLLLLRSSAGGAHCRNSYNCSLFGYIFMPAFGYIALLFSGCPMSLQYVYLTGCSTVVMLGVVLKAPFFTQDKPRAVARSKQLKIRAGLLAIFSLIAAIVLLYFKETKWGMGIATGLLFQGVMLFPPGVKAVSLFESCVNKLSLRGGGK
mgnify:CR=1 FL=1